MSPLAFACPQCGHPNEHRLVSCPTCRRDVSAKAQACPHCGHPLGNAVHTGVGTGEFWQRSSPHAAIVTSELASFWPRLGAALLDGLILLIPNVVAAAALPVIGGLAVGFTYNWLMLAFFGGQTLGKKAVGIVIAKPDGSPIDNGSAAIRAAMALVSGFALGLGYLWAAWDDENRTWHDMAANTRAFRSAK